MKRSLSILLFFLFLSMIYYGCTDNTPAARQSLEEVYKDKVVLIVNGDDLGITEIFTDATLYAYKKGAISSASIVSNGHDAERAIKLLKENPNLPVGIHLTLTGDWKPLTSGASLCNASGVMYNTAEEAAKYVIPAEAEAEWDAQIKRILDTGIEVTHIDTHMGCYFQTPELFAAACRLSKRYAIPLISPNEIGFISSNERKLFSVSSYTGIYRLSNQAETIENRTAAYWKMLGDLKSGIYYLFTHQGIEPADKNITGDLDLRINETKFWTSEETKKQLAEKGFVVIGGAPLKADFQAVLNEKK
ncbi:MAG: ChbG/HpnK family deacetylase [Bacteroidetes bacterium]|nr:ChbG/HpnK family deacetylase [Bacteroidota bacterium]